MDYIGHRHHSLLHYLSENLRSLSFLSVCSLLCIGEICLKEAWVGRSFLAESSEFSPPGRAADGSACSCRGCFRRRLVNSQDDDQQGEYGPGNRRYGGRHLVYSCDGIDHFLAKSAQYGPWGRRPGWQHASAVRSVACRNSVHRVQSDHRARFHAGRLYYPSSIDSYVISLLIETGIPGFVFFTGLLLLPVWYGLRSYLSDMSESGALAGALACSFIAYIANRLVLSQRENHMLIFSLLAIVIVMNYEYARKRAPNR